MQESFDAGKSLPTPIRQWVTELDFYQATFNVKLASIRGLSGVKEFRLATQVTGANGERPPQADDVGRSTFWVPRNYSGKIALRIGISSFAGLLKFLGRAKDSLAEPLLEIKYEWNPKVAKVISGAVGSEADWVLGAVGGEFLEGGHQLAMIIRRPRGLKDLKLIVHEEWTHYAATRFGRDIAYIKKAVEIPINFKSSQ